MAVTRLEVKSRAPFAGGKVFGEIGPYERIDGVMHFAVDPNHEGNQGIVDLELAPRAANGRVGFSADFCMLAPVDPARSRRRLFFEVLNRGRKTLPRNVQSAPAPDNPTSSEIDPGNGFLLRHGFTVVWCGWQWDVIRSEALLGLEAPLAMADGQPVGGEVVIQFQPNAWHRTHLLADRVHRPYPAADVDDPNARLTVRDSMYAPRTEVSRSAWRFAREEGAGVVADDTHLYLPSGFEPGRVYELVYRTRIAPVVGTGLLAVRDCVSFLRYAQGPENPCAGAIDWTFGFGVSQSSRFLRHFLHLGLNLDEENRQVFDGLLPHVGGARRGEFNHRFAQPSVQNTPSFGHLFPYADDEQVDPFTGRADGLLIHQRARGGMPKIFTVNSSAEYWRGDCSLLHTDPQGTHDVPLPADVRAYLFAGTQHGPGVLPLVSLNQNDGCRGAQPFNCLDYSPLLRAAIYNLDRWVTEGVEPPASAHPRLADGTAARPAALAATFKRIPGAGFPEAELIPSIRALDLGPEAERGVGRYPAKAGGAYPNYVSAVDIDGNEIGGIRLPDLTVPVATLTPWNLRHPETGGVGQIIPMEGSTLPFAPTAAARQRTGDPRPSIEERYAGREDYLVRVRVEAAKLIAAGYLLAEDLETVIDNCAARYDLFAGVPAKA